MMINRMAYKNQSMNMVHKTAEGTQLWLGDYYAATNTNLLKQKSIKSVLTSAAMLGIVYPKDLQITHKTINAFDLPSYKMTPHFEEAFQFIYDALKKGNILVHCAAGISRSTTFVLVYLMRADGMNFKQALDYVRSKRSIVYPNEGFQKQLKRYQTLSKKLFSKSEKPQIEEKMINSDTLGEKKIVLEFLKQDKKDNEKKGNQMNFTIGSGQPLTKTVLNDSNYENKGFPRGKSLNYSKKPNNILETNKKDNKDTKNEMRLKQHNLQYETNKLTKQFLTFKLQNPKIVTIKK